LRSTNLLEVVYDLIEDVRQEVQRSMGDSAFGETDRFTDENRLEKIEQGLEAIESSVEKGIDSYAHEFGIDPEDDPEPPSAGIKQDHRLRLVRRKS